VYPVFPVFQSPVFPYLNFPLSEVGPDVTTATAQTTSTPPPPTRVYTISCTVYILYRRQLPPATSLAHWACSCPFVLALASLLTSPLTYHTLEPQRTHAPTHAHLPSIPLTASVEARADCRFPEDFCPFALCFFSTSPPETRFQTHNSFCLWLAA